MGGSLELPTVASECWWDFKEIEQWGLTQRLSDSSPVQRSFWDPVLFLVPQGDGSFILRVLHATLQPDVRLI